MPLNIYFIYHTFQHVCCKSKTSFKIAQHEPVTWYLDGGKGNASTRKDLNKQFSSVAKKTEIGCHVVNFNEERKEIMWTLLQKSIYGIEIPFLIFATCCHLSAFCINFQRILKGLEVLNKSCLKLQFNFMDSASVEARGIML